MNRVTLMGRLTRDPELKKTNSGTAWTRFVLATNDGKSAKGEEIVNFVPCVAWGAIAELIGSTLKKGKGIVTDNASIQTGSYEDSEGNRHNVFQVVVRSFSYLEPKSQDKSSKGESSMALFGDEFVEF